MRVLFSSIFFSTMREPGVIAAATAKKNAELGSFGIKISSGLSGELSGAISIARPFREICAPIAFSIRSL